MFLDESGTHDGALVTVMAGYAINQADVPLLEQEWLEILGTHGLAELHMREFVPPHGRLAHWTESQKRGLLEPLIELIHKRSLVGVGAALALSEFMRGVQARSHKKVPELVESPYEWCFRYCAVQAKNFAVEHDVEGVIDYVLDQGCVDRHHLERGFDLTKKAVSDEQSRLGNLAFQDSKTTPALQCADLLAYEMYKEADRVIVQAPRSTRKSFLALLRDQDRLVTIKPVEVQEQVSLGANFIQAQVSLLPPKERFQVTCFALRSVTQEQREAMFQVLPHYREIYDRCLELREMGMRLADVPNELLCDDPEIIFPMIGLSSDGKALDPQESEELNLNLRLHGPFKY